MAKTATTAHDALVEAFHNFLIELESGAVAPVTASDVEDVEEEELPTPVREEVESLGIKELRTLAAQYAITDTKKADILAAFEDLYDEDDEAEVEEDDEDDEEAEDEEEEEYTRADLEEMTLKELRQVARDAEIEASEYKGMDQDAIIDLILGEEADEEDEEVEEDDEEVETLDEDALIAMTHRELVGLAKELEVKVPKALVKDNKANHKKLVALILDEGEEEE